MTTYRKKRSSEEREGEREIVCVLKSLSSSIANLSSDAIWLLLENLSRSHISLFNTSCKMGEERERETNQKLKKVLGSYVTCFVFWREGEKEKRSRIYANKMQIHA